jgi:two-component system, sensor histidine kinase and response regulator
MISRSLIVDLQQQIEQERLINRITALIYQSRELSGLLETTVRELRQGLAIDRLFIYSHPEHPTEQFSEAIAHDRIPSVRHRLASDEPLGLLELETMLSPDRDVVVAIQVQQQVWGFLVAQQVEPLDHLDSLDPWPDHDRQSLQTCIQTIAHHLSIAIEQTQRYEALHQEKVTLEQKVLERSQNLRDALFSVQSADRAKSEFLALVSHELRSPLTCVIGMASTLLRQFTGPMLPVEKQREYLETISDRGRRLLAIISDMLDLSQLETGRMLLNIREIAIVDLSKQILKDITPHAKAKQIQITLEDHFHSHPEAQSHFSADPERVQQILLNLLSNAVKFTPSGGGVTLRLWGNEADIFMQVVDSGIGIAVESQSMIFEKFQQLDSYRRRDYDGTGLGLAVTKQLVELHGGTIEVESDLGKGSTFTVHLPSQTRSAIEHAREYARNARLISHPFPQRILLLEEEEETANLLCDLLTPAEYQMTWMTDSDTAIGHLDAVKPSLVMVNWAVGVGVIEQLCEQVGQTKVLVLMTDERAIEALPQLTLPHFLPLPIRDPEWVIDKVNRLLNRG